MRPATKAALITGGVFIAVVAVLGIGVVVLEAIGFVLFHMPSYYYRLEYDNMYFDERDGAVNSVHMGSAGFLGDDGLKPFYIQLRNRPGKTYFLPELKEEEVRQFALSHHKRELGPKLETSYVLVTGDGAICEVTFCDRRPAGLYISGRTGIRISVTEDGEFVELPAKRRDIIRIFGKPLNIERREAEHMVH